jgi:hypothetical protein
VLVVQRGGGAVLLADGMDRTGSAELVDVVGADLRGKASGTSDSESSMWSTMTEGAWASSRSGTGSGAARNDQIQNPRQNSMSTRRNTSPVGTMSRTDSRVTAFGWSSAIR